jgi:hypothetical protein
VQGFWCSRCGSRVRFDAFRCPHCEAALGFDPGRRQVVALVSPSPGLFEAIDEPGPGRWRCLNAAWGCNWLLAAGQATPWCRSCALTRGRPDERDVAAVAAWADAETVKRRLIAQLDSLGLPVERGQSDPDGGLVFDLVFVPGHPGVTGHRNGVVTIDLTESDERRRDELRHALAEPSRTLLGHFRHEIGHYYWPALVERSDGIDRFRTCFGDERADYSAALDRYYGTGALAGPSEVHISRYASAHPWEDWAECFAHYLHLRDALETAEASGLWSAGTSPVTADDLLDQWQALAEGLNDVAAALGEGPLYPFALSGPVRAKLAFVHERVTAVSAGWRGPRSPAR